MSRAEEKALEAYKNEPCNKDTQNMVDGYIKGYEQAEQDYMEYAQLWVDSGEVNIKSFKQFLKDRGYE